MSYLYINTGCNNCDPENIDFNKVAKQLWPAENFDENEKVRLLKSNSPIC